jgi:nicotinamidase-related amidase
MKIKLHLISIFTFLSLFHSVGMAQTVSYPNTALILIDIQDFYFEGGRLPLSGSVEASLEAGKLLCWAREQKLPVIHVMHQGGGNIRTNVAPEAGEKLIVKTEINSFKGTDLQEYLKTKDIQTLILAGMQTNMCLEAATRAASDLGYKCIVIHDACAARDLVFKGVTVKAADVHYSTLVTLQNYARILSLDEFLKQCQELLKGKATVD